MNSLSSNSLRGVRFLSIMRDVDVFSLMENEPKTEIFLLLVKLVFYREGKERYKSFRSEVKKFVLSLFLPVFNICSTSIKSFKNRVLSLFQASYLEQWSLAMNVDKTCHRATYLVTK